MSSPNSTSNKSGCDPGCSNDSPSQRVNVIFSPNQTGQNSSSGSDSSSRKGCRGRKKTNQTTSSNETTRSIPYSPVPTLLLVPESLQSSQFNATYQTIPAGFMNVSAADPMSPRSGVSFPSPPPSPGNPRDNLTYTALPDRTFEMPPGRRMQYSPESQRTAGTYSGEYTLPHYDSSTFRGPQFSTTNESLPSEAPQSGYSECSSAFIPLRESSRPNATPKSEWHCNSVFPRNPLDTTEEFPAGGRRTPDSGFSPPAGRFGMPIPGGRSSPNICDTTCSYQPCGSSSSGGYGGTEFGDYTTSSRGHSETPRRIVQNTTVTREGSRVIVSSKRITDTDLETRISEEITETLDNSNYEGLSPEFGSSLPSTIPFTSSNATSGAFPEGTSSLPSSIPLLSSTGASGASSSLPSSIPFMSSQTTPGTTATSRPCRNDTSEESRKVMFATSSPCPCPPFVQQGLVAQATQYQSQGDQGPSFQGVLQSTPQEPSYSLQSTALRTTQGPSFQGVLQSTPQEPSYSLQSTALRTTQGLSFEGVSQSTPMSMTSQGPSFQGISQSTPMSLIAQGPSFQGVPQSTPISCLCQGLSLQGVPQSTPITGQPPSFQGVSQSTPISYAAPSFQGVSQSTPMSLATQGPSFQGVAQSTPMGDSAASSSMPSTIYGPSTTREPDTETFDCECDSSPETTTTSVGQNTGMENNTSPLFKNVENSSTVEDVSGSRCNQDTLPSEPPSPSAPGAMANTSNCMSECTCDACDSLTGVDTGTFRAELSLLELAEKDQLIQQLMQWQALRRKVLTSTATNTGL